MYWDDIEQRFFYRRVENKRESIFEAPISKIPIWGADVGSTQLVYSDLDPAKDLVRVFDEIEDALHTYVADKSERYTLIQQILLTKIHDESVHRLPKKASSPLDVQDYSIEAMTDIEVVRRLNAALSKAAGHYNQYLPSDKHIREGLHCPAQALRTVTKILAPINILGSKVQVIQGFYMKFAKSLYSWDLAQYFTPHEVIDFIVEVVNPKPGEHVNDPACGSADFLISAFRKAGPTADNCVWGADHSKQAVQVSILNMVLNGDGKTQIINQDSLEAYTSRSSLYSVVLCNPPFGTKIRESRFEVLRKFDMGRKWRRDETTNTLVMTDEMRTSQQTGILFAELCVRLTKPGGRIGIILPNGYLGNKSLEYLALREWLLRHTRLVGIVAFPRFTFKKSGADVSASVLFLERRKVALQSSSESKDYRFYAGNIESVGWRAGDKKAVPLYLRDPNDGSLVLNEENEPVLDADFDAVFDEFLRSPAVNDLPWAVEDRDIPPGPQTWSTSIKAIVGSSTLNLDPKRHSYKFNHLRQQIMAGKHFRLGDVLEPALPHRIKRRPAHTYKYVEIEQVGVGDYDYALLRGWQLPDRAKLAANTGDFFIPHLWSCAGKWFVAAGDCEDVIVTNGCAHFTVKAGKEKLVPDLTVGLCSDAFAIQMRAYATGSDGLAEASDENVLNIVLPSEMTAKLRTRVEAQMEFLMKGETRFARFAQDIMDESGKYPLAPARKSHCALV